MSDRARKVYWDACVWIALMNREPGRIEICRRILAEARRGKVEIWTSSLSRVEVLRHRCDPGVMQMEAQRAAAFENLLDQNFVKEVYLDRDVANLARSLVPAHTSLKKPNDAVHLASAAFYNVDEMHTYDDQDLTPLSGKVKCRDGTALKISHPAPGTGQDDLVDRLDGGDVPSPPA